MYWRLPHGGKLWEQNKGDKNKSAFRRLVKRGAVHGCLAFVADEPVGWCCLGPRGDFPRLERVKALQGDWPAGTWSVTCFFIRSKWRRRGVALALLQAAVDLARGAGAVALEGYPVRPTGSRPDDIPGAFAWTGVPRLFERLGFRKLDRPGRPRDILVKRFRRRAPVKPSSTPGPSAGR
jgi:GNAT superfamily N-acetyltransferase